MLKVEQRESMELERHLIGRAPEAVWCELAGESVILDMAKGYYFALDPIGTRIWGLLESPRSADSLCESLMEEYDVAPAQCRRDLLMLLNDLAGHGLVAIGDKGIA